MLLTAPMISNFTYPIASESPTRASSAISRAGSTMAYGPCCSLAHWPSGDVTIAP